MSNDDLLNEIAKIRERRKKIKRKSYSKTNSKLDKHRHEILFLYQHDASLRDIQIWLRKRRCSAHRTTIYRRIILWMEGLR